MQWAITDRQTRPSCAATKSSPLIAPPTSTPFPGHYLGRSMHIRVAVRSLNKNRVVHAEMLYFDEWVRLWLRRVSNSSPYAGGAAADDRTGSARQNKRRTSTQLCLTRTSALRLSRRATRTIRLCSGRGWVCRFQRILLLSLIRGLGEMLISADGVLAWIVMGANASDHNIPQSGMRGLFDDHLFY